MEIKIEQLKCLYRSTAPYTPKSVEYHQTYNKECLGRVGKHAMAYSKQLVQQMTQERQAVASLCKQYNLPWPTHIVPQPDDFH